jgi:ketosteroid isomerase-like protein
MKYGYVKIAALIGATVAPCNAAIAAPTNDVDAIKTILNTACVDMEKGKIDGTTWYFQPDIIVYDLVPPLISDADTVKEGNRHWHSIIDGPPKCTYEDIQVRMLGSKFAFSGSIIYLNAKLKEGGTLAIRMRSTDIWQKTKGGWRAIHEHTSVPFDPKTAKALFELPLNAPTGK